MTNALKVTLVKSRFGRLPKHRATLLALRLKKIGHTVVVPDLPQWRGMINKVRYLLSVEPVEKQ